MKDTIRKHALLNATKFDGKANPKAMIGKIMAEFPDAKKDMKTTMQIINEVVSEVNEMNIDEQLAELKDIAPELLEKKEKEKKDLKPLQLDDREVVMRFEPSPSGPMHIGHAYPASLNYLYAKKNNGRMILRISDTNPENIDPEAYEFLKKDAEWLFEGKAGEDFDVYIQSDRIEIYYKYAKELIEKDSAYICSCESEIFRNLLIEKKACPCRENSVEENLKRWEGMLNGDIAKGGAVMRFKSDIEHKNPAMRDFPLMRINEEEHPKQGKKYRVWPLMNMSVAIDDMDMKISHTLRGKDHADNAKKQEMIHNVLGYKTPIAMNVGRINFEGFPVSCSKTKALILEGKYSGWDDIRIPFLIPIRKRGYLASSIRDYAVEIGVTQNDKSVLIDEYFKTLNSINKSKLDADTNRLFFIDEPVEVEIKGAPVLNIELNFHPDKKDKGRKFKTNDKFYITKEDYDNITLKDDSEIFRLMDCLNFRKENDEFIFDSLEVEKFKEKGKMIIHWLSKNEAVSYKVRMTDNSIKEGLIEKSVESCKNGEIVQFERFGFCKLNEGEFWFCHK